MSTNELKHPYKRSQNECAYVCTYVVTRSEWTRNARGVDKSTIASKWVYSTELPFHFQMSNTAGTVWTRRGFAPGITAFCCCANDESKPDPVATMQHQNIDKRTRFVNLGSSVTIVNAMISVAKLFNFKVSFREEILYCCCYQCDKESTPINYNTQLILLKRLQKVVHTKLMNQFHHRKYFTLPVGNQDSSWMVKKA